MVRMATAECDVPKVSGRLLKPRIFTCCAILSQYCPECKYWNICYFVIWLISESSQSSTDWLSCLPLCTRIYRNLIQNPIKVMQFCQFNWILFSTFSAKMRCLQEKTNIGWLEKIQGKKVRQCQQKESISWKANWYKMPLNLTFSSPVQVLQKRSQHGFPNFCRCPRLPAGSDRRRKPWYCSIFFVA